MSGKQASPLVVTGLRGRDGSTASVGVSPEHGGIPWNKALEALNVDTYRAQLARKRGGSTSLSLTFGAGGPFTDIIESLIGHVPSGVLTAAELWALDADFVVGRLAGGTSWSAPTLKDTPTTGYCTAVSLNGKLYFAFNSNQSRLHVWDGSTVRRVGLATPAAPTVANTGAGAYPATIRYYRVRYTEQSGGVTVRRSEPSASTSFTPSGAGTHARVTKPAALSEGETHWELEASEDDANFYVIATTAVGTTTHDDNLTVSTYNDGAYDLSAIAGTYTNWGAVQWLTTDDSRLLGASLWDSTKLNRVYFSPVIGTISAGFADEERVPDTTIQKNYIDINEKDGGFITGLSKPFNGAIWVFKNDQIHRLTPTGYDTRPYRRHSLDSKGIGCFRQPTIVHAVDELGNPALYWLSHAGPYRVTLTSGLQAMVDDIQDVWDTVNKDVCYGISGQPHGVYHADKHQIWWWIPTSGSATNNKKIVFDTLLGRVVNGRVRDGWFVHDGDTAAARCSVMFSNTVGASMSADLKPYIGRATGTAVQKCDTSDASDNGTSFQAYVDLPDRHLAGTGRNLQVTGASVLGSVGSQSLRLTLTGDYGAVAARTYDASMAAAGSETRKRAPFENAEVADVSAVRVRIGDSAASTATWTLDELRLRWEQREDVLP